MRRRTVLLSSSGFLTLASGCLGDGSGNGESNVDDLPEEATIDVTGAGFDPLSVHVSPGGSVTWENTGEEAHRIDAFQFTTAYTAWSYREDIEPGESVSYTFEDDGLYGYTDQGRGGQYSVCGRVRVGSVDDDQALPCE